MLPALLVWALEIDQQTVAACLGWPAGQVTAWLRRFSRRCTSLRLTPRIPPGRDFVKRYHRVLSLLHRSTDQTRDTAGSTDLLSTIAEAVDTLVNHPLAGTPEAHALRAVVSRLVATRAA
jgi:hypothetical protein